MPQDFELSSSRNGGINSTTRSSQDDDDDDEGSLAEIRREISRLQMLERGIAKSGRSFTVKKDEEERLATKNARVRKGISVLIGIALLVGVVFGIMAIAKYMKNNDVKFLQGSGGNTPTSLQQLEAHNTEEDCWLILHGDVYDLTSYADRHPGGAYWITDQCGQDGTELYDAFHPTSLLKTVKRFQIGPFVETSGQEDISNPVDGADDNSDQQQPPEASAPGAGASSEASSQESSDANDDNESGDKNENEYGSGIGGGDDEQQVAVQPTSPPAEAPVGQQVVVQPTQPPTKAPVAEPPQEVDYSVCRPDCSVPISELQRHNTANNLWMAVYGVVYDLTDYASKHPGGSRVVVNVAGTVMSTIEFERYHKEKDVRKVEQYIVGNLA